MRKKWMRIIGILGTIAVIGTACGNDGEDAALPTDGGGKGQFFYVKVESVGETAEKATGQARSGRPLFSMSPKQTIDKVELILVKNDASAEVVCRKEITGWSDTDNRVSYTYVEGNKRGRKALVSLTEGQAVPDGSYLAYAVGYHSGSYGQYKPFDRLVRDGRLTGTESVTVPPGGYADEIFAGAMIFTVRDGQFKSAPVTGEERAEPEVILRRQVAGTFGYFTGIPATVGGEAVARLRLVAGIRNRTVVFAGFRSIENPDAFNQENVINGCRPRTDYDARLDGSAADDAFVVYDIELAKWFPGNEDGPLDLNGDGILDKQDANWQVDPQMKEQGGSLSVAPGSVFGDSFWVPVPITQAEIDRKLPTFQLQLIGRDGESILKSWNLLLRGDAELYVTRTVVSIDEQDQASIYTEKNPEVELTYSIARNHLYTIGTKNSDASYGEDEPVYLKREEAEATLRMDVNPEWEALDTVIFH